MNWNLLLPLLITTVVAILGWVIAHRLAAARDRANKRRDLVITYLLDAYRRLEANTNRPAGKADNAAIESAIADIQLLGTRTHVELAARFVRQAVESKSAYLDELLAALREDLRAELGLESVGDEIRYFRVSKTGSNAA